MAVAKSTIDQTDSLATLDIDPDHLTSAGSRLGTVGYMSPEEEVRGKPLDPCTDLFFHLLPSFTKWQPGTCCFVEV